jgi:hypothetical protein
MFQKRISHTIDAGGIMKGLPEAWKQQYSLSLLSPCSTNTTPLFVDFVVMMIALFRADCQWSNEDSLFNHNTNVLPKVAKKHGINKGALQDRPEKGKLPRSVPEPLFVADPNHRRKGLTGELIKLDSHGWNSS